MLPNATKYAPHSAHEVELKGGRGEALRTVGIRITFGVLSILNTTPEMSKADLESVIPYDVRLGNDAFTYLDVITVYEVIVDHWGGTVTQMM